MIAKATEVASNFVNFTDSSNFTRQGMPQIKTCQRFNVSFHRNQGGGSARGRVRKRNSAGNGAESREFLKFPPRFPGQCHELKLFRRWNLFLHLLISDYFVSEK